MSSGRKWKGLTETKTFEELRPSELDEYRKMASVKEAYQYVGGKATSTKNNGDPALEQVLKRNKRLSRPGVQPFLIERKIEELAEKYNLSVTEMRRLITAPYHLARTVINQMELTDYKDAPVFSIPYFGKIVPKPSVIVKRMALLKILHEGRLNGTFEIRDKRGSSSRIILASTPEDSSCLERGW